jgi:hypothetical protein
VWRTIVEDRSTVERWGDATFVLDDGVEVSERFAVGFDVAGKAVKAAEAFEFLGVSELGSIEGAAEDGQGFVVGFEGDREGVAVFASVGEGETGGIGEATGRAVDDFGDEGEGLEGARPQAFHKEK